ncbi:MAG: RluA family pseudouridine synthase [Peptococcaceae bacterium]|nr:RluA family pseudouridine synthase [Peptococcaceae bacterium]
MHRHSYIVSDEDAGERIDRFLATHSTLSRSRVQNLISEGMVTVANRAIRSSYRLKEGDRIELVIPDPAPLSIKPQPIPLDIFFEDDDVIVVNKPRGMVVHPAAGNFYDTLVNALLYHCDNLSGINGVLRPGIVHRLDKDTSGLLMVAKNDAAHQNLANQLKQRIVIRRYTALVFGVLRKEQGVIESLIGRHPKDRKKMAVVTRNGKPAITHYRVLQRLGRYTLIELRLETGRTHQIRVHMAHIGHPLVGDLTYGKAKPHLGLYGQFLHAGVLGFTHPRTGEQLVFKAPLPGELQAVLDRLVISDNAQIP